MKIVLHAALFALTVSAAAVAMASKAAAPEAPAAAPSAHQQWLAAAVAELGQRDDADAQFAAALLGINLGALDRSGPDAKTEHTALARLDRAAALAPKAADVAAMALQVCARLPACDASPRQARLQALQPDNAANWWPVLAQAAQDKDEAAVTAALQRMGAAKTIDHHWLAVSARLARALATVPAQEPALPPAWADLGDAALRARARDFGRQVQASVLAMNPTQPQYQKLVSACDPAGPHFAQRRADCRRIGLLLEAGPSLIDNRIGLVLHRRGARDAADRKQVLAQERSMDWLMHLQTDKLAPHAGLPDDQAQWTAADLDRFLDRSEAMMQARRSAGGELAGIRQQARAAGLPLTPPADWVDTRQQTRIARDAERKQAAEAG